MNFKYVVSLLLILAVAGSCTKRFEKMNTNPVLISKDIIQPSMLFTAVLKTSIYASFANTTIKEYSGYYSNEASGTIFQDRDWTTPFSDYQGNLINIADVVRLTEGKPELSDENAVARIWKVWLFHQLTDAYGDLPYSQALKGVDSVITQPAYDTQQAIYEDMLNELKTAASQLGSGSGQSSFGDADILFHGDVDHWKRFANSLRLRLALRVRYADATLAQQHIGDLAGAPMIDDNSLNATLATIDGTDVNNNNPLYNDYVYSSGYPVWVGFSVTQELLKRNDPRLPKFAVPADAPAAGYRGRPMSLLNDQKPHYALDSTAKLPLSFQQPVYNIIVMSAAEVYLLRSEAALVGLSSEDPQEMFTKGIQASMEQYQVAAGDIANYQASSFATLSGAEEDRLENIIEQKYLALYHQGNEGWAEWRRTGYPKIWTGNDFGSTNGNIPRRLTYPQSEYLLNNANVAAAASRLQGGDKMLSRVWWDAKPGLPFLHPRQGMFPPEIY